MRDRTKLPKWAQQELARLEQSVEYWQGLAVVGPEGSDTFVRQGWTREAGQLLKPLGDSPSILFDTQSGRIEARVQDDYLQVASYGAGWLQIRPQSSNVVRVFGGGNA